MTERETWLDEDGETITELSISQLAHYLPQMLTWESEPEVRNGDIFVFRWGKIHGRYDAVPDGDERKGRPYQSTFPDVYIRLTANPIRHKRGHWQAPFTRVGFDTTEYLKRGGGTIANPMASSVIDREVPAETAEIEPSEADELMRMAKRRTIASQNSRPGRRERQLKRAA
jgi:hypothetical protein